MKVNDKLKSFGMVWSYILRTNQIPKFINKQYIKEKLMNHCKLFVWPLCIDKHNRKSVAFKLSSLIVIQQLDLIYDDPVMFSDICF